MTLVQIGAIPKHDLEACRRLCDARHSHSLTLPGWTA
jgi:hypothetical protein